MHNYQFIEDQNKKPLLIYYGQLGKCQLLAHRITKKLYVLKLAKKDPQIYKDIQCLTKMKHPYIIKLHQNFEYSTNIIMIFQFLPNADLYTKIKSAQLLFSQIKPIFRKICEAIKYIHSVNVIHRNLKSENIMFDEKMNPKIIDFCYAARLTSRQTFCGCFYYMAPEILTHSKYTQKADIWALGVILFEIVNQHVPFEQQHPQKIMERIHKSLYLKSKYPVDSVDDLITKMMRIEPNQRICIDQVLAHPYLSSTSEQSVKQQLIMRNQFIQKEEQKRKDSSIPDYFSHKILSILDCSSFEKSKKKILLRKQRKKL